MTEVNCYDQRPVYEINIVKQMDMVTDLVFMWLYYTHDIDKFFWNKEK